MTNSKVEPLLGFRCNNSAPINSITCNSHNVSVGKLNSIAEGLTGMVERTFEEAKRLIGPESNLAWVTNSDSETLRWEE